MNAASESITRHELTAALIHLEHSGDKPRCDSCWDKAGSILDHIEAHREPEYEPGEIYEDAKEVRYLRLGSESFPWLLLGRNGVPVPNLVGAPATPLRKPVPEGPQSAKPSHFDVLAEIVTGLGHDETDKQLADRICKLLEGGTS